MVRTLSEHVHWHCDDGINLSLYLPIFLEFSTKYGCILYKNQKVK